MKTIKDIFLVLTFLHLFWRINAHPSWGIVVTDDGCVYFADVMHNGDGTLWKLDPETMHLEAIEKRFHAHQICINEDEEIFAGVAIWRSGEIEEEGHNYLFKYDTKNQTMDTLLFTDDWDEYHGQTFSMSEDYSEIYFTIHNQVFVKPINGKTKKLIEFDFPRVNTLTTDPQGNLWISSSMHENGSLFKWNKDEGLKKVATDLIPQDPSAPIFEEKRFHLFNGISFTDKGNPLITENADRAIKEILPKGSSKIVFTSDAFWAPCGVYFHDNKYYIMEAGYRNGHFGPRIIIADNNFVRQQIIEIDYNAETARRLPEK